jgi:hypothetical protein
MEFTLDHSVSLCQKIQRPQTLLQNLAKTLNGTLVHDVGRFRPVALLQTDRCLTRFSGRDSDDDGEGVDHPRDLNVGLFAGASDADVHRRVGAQLPRVQDEVGANAASDGEDVRRRDEFVHLFGLRRRDQIQNGVRQRGDELRTDSRIRG